jgi:AsmA protein
MSNLKILGGIVGGVIVLLVAALMAAWVLVNPNHYKAAIAAAVKESTGRDLKIPGDIQLSIFPWVALELGPASLGNPPGFGNEPLLSLTHAALRVRLLPLLRRRLEVTRVDIDGLDMRLLKNAEGRGNWQAADTAERSSEGADRAPAARSLASLADVRVRHGRVRYENVTVENFNLETGSAAHEQHIPVSVTFDANRGMPAEQISVNAKFNLSGNSAQSAARLDAVNVSGTLRRPGDDRPVPWDFAAPALDANLEQQTLKAPAFTLSYLSARMSGNAALLNMFDDLHMSGSVSLMPVVLHELLPRLGVRLPATRDPKAFSQFAGATDFAYEQNALSLSNLQARLDDTQIEGTIKYSIGDTEAITFDLRADQIDADRYRGTRAAAAAGSQADNERTDRAKPFEASGTLSVSAAHFSGMDFTKVHLAAASKDHVWHLFPTEAQIDGGRYAGDITLDDREPVRVVSIDAHLAGVDMARLLANSPHKYRLSGRATLNLKGVARGATMDALLKTWDGHLDADLTEGALEGIDLAYEVNRAQALIDRAVVPRDDTKRTRFDAFKTSAQITKGIAETQDLTISSEALRVKGQGSANLSTNAINFQLTASILKAPASTLVDIPLKVAGTYQDPTVKVEITAVAKDALKQKLQDILKKNGLQGLFGK